MRLALDLLAYGKSFIGEVVGQYERQTAFTSVRSEFTNKMVDLQLKYNISLPVIVVIYFAMGCSKQGEVQPEGKLEEKALPQETEQVVVSGESDSSRSDRFDYLRGSEEVSAILSDDASERSLSFPDIKCEWSIVHARYNMSPHD